eukprot:4871998-Prymnesium_polylepis.1
MSDTHGWGLGHLGESLDHVKHRVANAGAEVVRHAARIGRQLLERRQVALRTRVSYGAHSSRSPRDPTQ